MLLRHYSVSVCLYTGALAYCICHLQQRLRGSAGLEKPCIQEACVQLITDQLRA